MTDRLISLQAAVDEISKYASIWMEYDGGMTQEEVAEAALKAAKRTMVHILEELPSVQPEQRWIPWDSGRFPDDSGTYIVTAYDGAQERVTFAKYQKRPKRWELTGARAYWRVLAWMPLPEPYKENKDERD